MYYYNYENVNCCYKYLMFSYNIIFWFLGAALIAAGLWAWSEKFSSMVGLIFLGEVLVVVLVFVFQSHVYNWINMFFLNNIKAYRDDLDLQNLLDSLQTQNWCCGAQGPEDWDQNQYFSCNKTNPSREMCGVPFSCCVPDPADSVVNTQCGYDVRTKLKKDWQDLIWTRGCISALEQWLPGNLLTVALVFVAVSVLQMLGIFLARTLITDIYKVQINHNRQLVY